MDIVIIAFGFAGYLHFVALILKAFLWGWWVGLWRTPPEAVGLSLIYAGLNPSTGNFRGRNRGYKQASNPGDFLMMMMMMHTPSCTIVAHYISKDFSEKKQVSPYLHKPLA